jgi:hypothetical protein
MHQGCLPHVLSSGKVLRWRQHSLFPHRSVDQKPLRLPALEDPGKSAHIVVLTVEAKPSMPLVVCAANPFPASGLDLCLARGERGRCDRPGSRAPQRQCSVPRLRSCMGAWGVRFSLRVSASGSLPPQIIHPFTSTLSASDWAMIPDVGKGEGLDTDAFSIRVDEEKRRRPTQLGNRFQSSTSDRAPARN